MDTINRTPHGLTAAQGKSASKGGLQMSIKAKLIIYRLIDQANAQRISAWAQGKITERGCLHA